MQEPTSPDCSPETEPRNIVVMATDDNPMYSFFAPLSAYYWKNVAGYKPILFVVDTLPPRKTLTYTLMSYTDHGWLQYLRHSETVPNRHVAQISRLYAAQDGSCYDNDFILTTDIDMWPLARQWIQPIAREQIHIWGANLYAHEPELKFPLSYVGMPCRLWKHVMAMEPPRMIVDYIEHEWEFGGMKTADGPTQWSFDERLFAGKLTAWLPCRADEIYKIARQGSRHGFVEGRVDRGRWVPAKRGERGMKDAHLVRPGYSDENWSKLKELMLWIEESTGVPVPDWADEYRTKFLELLKEEGGG